MFQPQVVKACFWETDQPDHYKLANNFPAVIGSVSCR